MMNSDLLAFFERACKLTAATLIVLLLAVTGGAAAQETTGNSPSGTASLAEDAPPGANDTFGPDETPPGAIEEKIPGVGVTPDGRIVHARSLEERDLLPNTDGATPAAVFFEGDIGIDCREPLSRTEGITECRDS